MVSDITTTSVTVAVAATPGCDIESIIIEYRQDASDPYINIASGVCSDLIGTEYDLTGLAANTTYFLRASATLEYSIIVDDVVTTFTTDPIAQTAVTSVAVSNITPTTVRVVITTDNQSASLLRTAYRYRTTGVGTWTGDYQAGQMTWTVELTGLTGSTAYEFSAVVTGSGNNVDPNGSWFFIPAPIETTFTTTASNVAPTASASANPTTVNQGATVTLTGVAADTDSGDTLTYAWTSNGGGTFSSTTALSPTWVAPGVSSSTTVTLTLTVNDGTVSTAATTTVTVNPLPSAITSVTARSVGPERVQIIANLTYINSTTAINFRYRVTSPPGVWTTASVNASANDTTAIHKITSGLVADTEYDFEASLSSNFAASVSTTHTHVATMLILIDTNTEKMYEFRDVSTSTWVDSLLWTFDDATQTIRSITEHLGWVYYINYDDNHLHRSRTPLVKDSWTDLGALPSTPTVTRGSESLVSIEGNLYNLIHTSTSNELHRIVHPSAPSEGVVDIGDTAFYTRGSTYRDGTLFLLDNTSVKVVPDFNSPSTGTTTAITGLTGGRGMTVYNDRIFFNDEPGKDMHELMFMGGTITSMKLADYGTHIIWGASMAAWSGNSAAIVSSVSIDSIAGTTATVNITATAATAAGVDFRFRYRIGAGGWTDASVSSTTTTAAISLTGLTANQLYEYQASLDSAFPEDDRTEGTFTTLAGVLESHWSAEVEVRTLSSATVPGIPTNLALTPADSEIAVTWSAPASDGGSTLTGYDLDYKLSSSSNWINSTHSGLVRTFTITSLTNAANYNIRVAAINDRGTGSYVTGTAAPVAAATVPGIPTNLVLTPGDTQIEVAWTAPADNGGSVITGYDLEYKLSSSSNWINTTHSGIGITFTITGLTNAANYNIRVAAINLPGTGSYVTGTSSPVSSATVPGGPPTGLSLTPSDTQIALSWTAPTDNGGSALTGYSVQYSSDGGNTFTSWSHTNTSTSATITGLTNGQSYQVRVAAINSEGTGAYVTGTTTLADRPGAPTGLTFTPGDAQLEVNWTAPSNNGGRTITGYDVEYRSGVGGSFTGASHTGTATTATITGLTNGQAYQVRVRAKNSYGAGAWFSASSTPNAPLLLTHFSTTNIGVEASALITAGAGGSWYGVSPRSVSGALIDGDLNLGTSNTPVTGVDRESTYVLVSDNSALDLSTYFGTSGAGAELWLWIQSATDGSDLVHSTGTSNAAAGSIRFTFSGAPPSFNTDERIIVAFASPDPPSAPAAPTLTISGSGTIDVAWLPPTSSGYSSIADYDVRYKESLVTGWGALSHSGTALSASITGLTNGTSYDVAVRASNADATGPWSTLSTQTPANLGGPGAPDPPTLTSGDQQISVSWNEPSDNGGSAIDGYDVEWRQGTEGDWTELDHTGLVRSAVITGLTNGQEYQVQVRANNSVASGNWSGTSLATPSTTPAQVGLPGLVVKSESLIVSWVEPANNGAPISDYDVQYRAGAAGGFTSWYRVGTDTEITITGLTNGQSYEIQVRAENSNGLGPWSESATGTPADFPDAPATPTTASQDTKLAASWTAPANNGGTIIGYDVEYREGTEGGWEVHTHLGTATTATITGLRNGQPYQVQVRGINVRGAGPWSQAGLGTPYGAMGPPTNVTLAASNEEITVEWEPPTQTGGRVVTSYRVVYYETSAGSSSATGQSDPISLNLRTKTITGLTNGTSYSVYVFATYAGGNGTSSSTQTATPVPPAPDAPSDLAQTSGDAQIDLTWTAPSMGAITSYDYSTDDGASWRTTGSTAASYTATHTSGSTSTALVNGTEYTFRVRGENAGGPGSQSNSIKATPRTIPAQVVISGTTHGDQEVTITWTAPNNGGSAITSYDYRVGAAGSAHDVGNADISTTSVTVGSLINGTEYQLYIRAVNVAGNGPWSAASAETPSTTPRAPIDIASVGADVEVALSWTAQGDGGSAITSYDYSTDDGASWRTTGSTAASYTATHTSGSTSTALVNDTEYFFRVRAVNANGTGAPSLPSSGTPHEPSSVSSISAFNLRPYRSYPRS